MTIPLIAIPILWTAICIAAFFLWPRDSRNADYGIDLIPIFLAFVAIIGILIGWIGWLLYLVLK